MRVLLALLLLTSAASAAQTSRIVLWGRGGVDGSESLRLVPETAAAPSRHLATGFVSSYSIREDGSVVAWGTPPVSVPEGVTGIVQLVSTRALLARMEDGTVRAWGNDPIVTDLPADLQGIQQIAAGHSFGLALREDGTVVAWGSNQRGETDVPSDLGPVTQITAGAYFASALLADGTVRAWGWNHRGETDVPVDLTDIVAIAAGKRHMLALRSDGTVRAWGDDRSGAATPPADLTDAVHIDAGGSGSLALRPDGTVVTWGSTPRLPSGLRLAEVALGGGHLLGRTLDGEVRAWGVNDFGQAAVPRGLPSPVEISLGLLHAIVRHADGTVTGWGADDWGAALNTPADLDGVAQLATGWDLSIALRTDGTVVSWGADYYGQYPPSGLSGVVQVAAYDELSAALFEDGRAETYGLSPPAPAEDDFVQIAAGSYFVLGLREDGTVVASDHASAPLPPDGLSGVVQIEAGGQHALALLADGTVVGWGDGPAATPPEDLRDVIQISTSSSHSLALLADGSVVAWGSAASGALDVPVGLIASFVEAGESISAAVTGAPATSAEPNGGPLVSALRAPAPNPARGPVSIRYDLATATPILLDVLDLRGRRVATLAEGLRPSGAHEGVWNPDTLAAGTYVVRLRAGGTVQARRVAVVR